MLVDILVIDLVVDGVDVPEITILGPKVRVSAPSVSSSSKIDTASAIGVGNTTPFEVMSVTINEV